MSANSHDSRKNNYTKNANRFAYPYNELTVVQWRSVGKKIEEAIKITYSSDLLSDVEFYVSIRAGFTMSSSRITAG
jgi:hypothetical protein